MSFVLPLACSERGVYGRRSTVSGRPNKETSFRNERESVGIVWVRELLQAVPSSGLEVLLFWESFVEKKSDALSNGLKMELQKSSFMTQTGGSTSAAGKINCFCC